MAPFRDTDVEGSSGRAGGGRGLVRLRLPVQQRALWRLCSGFRSSKCLAEFV